MVLAIAATCAAEAAAPRACEIVVEAGPHARLHTPVVFALPEAMKDTHAVRLTQLRPASEVESQILPGEPSRVIFILDSLPAGATRHFRLEPAEPTGAEKEAVTCMDDGKRLRLRVGDRPVLQYNAAMVESPEGIEPYYRRSGQIHPLFTPSGRIVSDDFPPDHAHQHGVFFAWVNTTFEGRHLDFWNQKEQTGRIEHAAILETTSGPVFGQFQVKLRHDDLSAPGGPKPVLDEVWTVRTYNVSDVFLVDLESRQTCAGPVPSPSTSIITAGWACAGTATGLTRP